MEEALEKICVLLKIKLSEEDKRKYIFTLNNPNLLHSLITEKSSKNVLNKKDNYNFGLYFISKEKDSNATFLGPDSCFFNKYIKDEKDREFLRYVMDLYLSSFEVSKLCMIYYQLKFKQFYKDVKIDNQNNYVID